jgi:hypothetical protein
VSGLSGAKGGPRFALGEGLIVLAFHKIVMHSASYSSFNQSHGYWPRPPRKCNLFVSCE